MEQESSTSGPFGRWTYKSVRCCCKQRQRSSRYSCIHLNDEETEIANETGIDGKFYLAAILDRVIDFELFLLSTAKIGVDEGILTIVILFDLPLFSACACWNNLLCELGLDGISNVSFQHIRVIG